MKILIAYDGSQSSEAALDDLHLMGLPRLGEALVMTVAEVWLPPPQSAANGVSENDYIESLVAKNREKGERLLNEAGVRASHAVGRVRKVLTAWAVTPAATYGSPAWEIITAADNFDPDIIVVGSQGHSMISRMMLGSISQKVMTEAKCTVRIARGKIEVDPVPVRILIGFDGSPGAQAAVDVVASRCWPSGSEVRLVAATDSVIPTAIGRFIPPISDWAEDEQRAEYEWIDKLISQAKLSLTKVGISVTTSIIQGKPSSVLVGESENWRADCIFVGANAFGSRLERFLLGSTSSAVAAHARCSVEIVRRPAR